MLAGPIHPADAAQRLAVRVTRHDTRFAIAMRIALREPPWAVFAALQDYTALPYYNPDIRRVRIEPAGRPGRLRVAMTIHACVLFLCKTLRQTAVMTATAAVDGGVIRAVIMPGQGDFRSGQALWRVSPCPTGRDPACLHVRMTLRPRFWVPPLIGAWLLRRKLTEEARRSVGGIEQLAASLLAHCAAAPRRNRPPRGCAKPPPIGRPTPTSRPARSTSGNGVGWRLSL
ncbi:MAG: SRPBCC family protein [Steroidobacteraceae bacterium]